MSLLDNLPHLATARRRMRTTDSLGGSRDAYAEPLFVDRACWLQPFGATGRLEQQRQETAVSGVVYFAECPGVDERYLLVIGGDVYSVTSASHLDSSVGFGVLWRVNVEHVGSVDDFPGLDQP